MGSNLYKMAGFSHFQNWHGPCNTSGNRRNDEHRHSLQGVSTMFAQTSDLRRNVVAMFFAVLFSAVTVVAAVGPANVSASATVAAA
jgi:diacylglycerol kinase